MHCHPTSHLFSTCPKAKATLSLPAVAKMNRPLALALACLLLAQATFAAAAGPNVRIGHITQSCCLPCTFPLSTHSLPACPPACLTARLFACPPCPSAHPLAKNACLAHPLTPAHHTVPTLLQKLNNKDGPHGRKLLRALLQSSSGGGGKPKACE